MLNLTTASLVRVPAPLTALRAQPEALRGGTLPLSRSCRQFRIIVPFAGLD